MCFILKRCIFEGSKRKNMRVNGIDKPKNDIHNKKKDNEISNAETMKIFHIDCILSNLCATFH